MRGLVAGGPGAALVGPERLHQGVAWIAVALCVLACLPSGLRWLRVAQREHYLAGSVTRFAGRWWRTTPANVALAVVVAAAAVASVRWPLAGVLVAVGVAVVCLVLGSRVFVRENA